MDFVGKGPGLRCVESVMPPCDGLLPIMEASAECKGHCSRDGVDIKLFLEKSVMERLLQDAELWGGDV